MPDIAFNLVWLLAAHTQGVRFTTEEKPFCISRTSIGRRELKVVDPVTPDSLDGWSQTTDMRRSA